MKWPNWLKLIRHDTSVYNMLRNTKRSDQLYQAFRIAWDKDPNDQDTRHLAQQVCDKFALGVGDAETPLADIEGKQAFEVGTQLSSSELPDALFVSPYKRALCTLEHIMRGWPNLQSVKIYEEERIREQEHGLALLYNDWRVFHALHPEQRRLHQLEGPYWYRYPQGENVPDVRERNRSWLGTLTREFAGANVFVVTHHLNILATRANLERLSAEEFLRLDEEEKPINCGVTTYVGEPDMGKNGQLKLAVYNEKLYS